MQGEVVAERFEVGRKIGAGGMGTVHRAVDRLTGETVALKLLRARGDDGQTLPDAIDIARFEREASLLAQLEHPGVVRYVAHGQSGDRVWLAMEWLEGQTLADRLQRRGLTLPEAVSVVRQAAEALAPAHARGVVHRDLKPANLFLVGGDPAQLKVLDFGIARALGAGHTLTHTGTAIGTPHYMSPEQARAEKGVDPSTDVYALGVVLYECLAGQRPFEGESPIAVLAKILLEEPPPLVVRVPDVPPTLDALLQRLLAKDPAERPANGARLAAELAALGPLRPSERPAPHAPALGDSEQRLLCVVLAADVGLHGASAPTVLGTDELSTDLHGELRELARAHGAKVEFLADGSLVATVGGRGMPTDLADRAARLALALRDVLPDAPLAVVAGRSVLTERLPAGEVVDRGVAALEAAPAPIEGRRPVRIDDLIDGLLDERFAREGTAGERLLLGARGAETPRRTLLGREVPCVGRKRELGTLHAIFDEVVDEPVARAVLVTGPAGGGKTRVLQELLAALAEDDATLLLGRADPMRSSPYAALASAVRGAAGIVDGEPLDVRRRKLAARIGEVVPSSGGGVAGESPRARLTAFLGELVRVPFGGERLASLEAARRDPQLMGDAMRTAFEDWLAAEAARRPVVLAIEDLQWADRPSVQALDAALRHLEEAPLMVIATGRPEVEQTFPGLWADRDRLDVHLARLTKRSAAKLVRAALPEADEALVAQLVARADGNAFFLEELVRAVARDADAALPESILGMVEARLGELDPAARRVLRAASVFGARFWTGGVGHLLGPADAPAAERWLTLFAEDELIGRAATSAFPAETEWRFRQALLRDAAYATLTDEDRRLGHRLAAEWLEEAGEQDAATLAEHLDRAGEGARAAARYAQAADRALEAGDFERVLDLAKRALEGSELSPGLRGRLRLHQAEAHRWRAEYAQAADRALAALEHLPPGSEAWFQAVGNVVVASGVRGDAETAKRWSERALGTPAATEEAARARLVALCRAAHQQLGAGDLAAADRTIGAAAKTAGTLEAADPWTDAWLATTRAARSLHAGEIGPYLEGTAAAIRAYDAAGDVRHACNQRVRLGYGYVEVGDLPRAEEELRAALQQAERLGVPLVAGYALQNLGWVRALRGDAKEGRALEERALALGQRLGNPGLEGGARFYLGQIARAAGDAAAAVAQGEAALHAVESIPPLRTLCLAALARALRLAGRGEEALARAREASDARGTLASMEEGEALVWLAYLEALDAGAPPEERARAAGQARAALERRLAKLPAEHRRSYLAVPDHAALARAVGLA